MEPDVFRQWNGPSAPEAAAFNHELYHEVAQFLYREARLQDTHDYGA